MPYKPPATLSAPILDALYAVDLERIDQYNYLIHSAAFIQNIMNFVDTAVQQAGELGELEHGLMSADDLVQAYYDSFMAYYQHDVQRVMRDFKKAEDLVDILYHTADTYMMGERGCHIMQFMMGLGACCNELKAQKASALDVNSSDLAQMDLNDVECKMSMEQLVRGIDMTLETLGTINRENTHNDSITDLKTLRQEAHAIEYPKQQQIDTYVRRYEGIMQRAANHDPDNRGLLMRLMDKVVAMVNRAVEAFSANFHGLFSRKPEAPVESAGAKLSVKSSAIN